MSRTLDPIRPNAGIEAAFRKKLLTMVDAMHRSIERRVIAAYRRNEPNTTAEALAEDASPSMELRTLLRRLGRDWRAKFDRAAPELAAYFSRSMRRRSDAALRSILLRGGLAVEFKLTPAMRDVMNATITDQVGLIRSIAARHLSEVEGMVMRSVAAGRDLKQLTDDLQSSYGVTRRRAELIARDQNNKATATMTRARQAEVGVTHAIWVHSHGGKVPRPSHVKAGRDGAVYEVAKGWYDPDEDKFILPGELINCRCVSRPIPPWKTAEVLAKRAA